MKRIAVLTGGVLVTSAGIAVCNYTSLGIDPLDAFCAGLSDWSHIQLGTVVLLVQLLIAVCSCLLNRKYLGIGSLIQMVILGYALQFFYEFLLQVAPAHLSFPVRFLIFFVGMIVTAFGMSVYIGCDLGMAPYDGLSFLLSEYLHCDAFRLRVVLDSIVVLMAIILKGPIHMGTILLAFLTGPLIGLFSGVLKGRMVREEADNSQG